MASFIDTNILIYSVSRSPRETEKRDRAVEILKRRDCVLSVQVLQEFYYQVTRPSKSDVLPHDIAADLIRTWLRFKTVEMSVELLLRAMRICSVHKLSYWDSAIVAAAQISGCSTLISEDMGGGSKFGEVRIVNPFL